jgi:hypothetical protein
MDTVHQLSLRQHVVKADLLQRTILRILVLSYIYWAGYCHLRLLRNICPPVFESGVRKVLRDPDRYIPSLGVDEGDAVWLMGLLLVYSLSL